METNYITEKLNKFSALVLNDARERRGNMIKEVHEQYDKRIDEKETELLECAYESIQSAVKLARKEARERVLHTETESRRKLILKREEIIDAVMKEAAGRLEEFRASDEYGDWLTAKTVKAIKELGDGSKTVLISADDMKYADKIKALGNEITVEALKTRDINGGVRVINETRHIAADYTFDELLALRKKHFLRESGLTLN